MNEQPPDKKQVATLTAGMAVLVLSCESFLFDECRRAGDGIGGVWMGLVWNPLVNLGLIFIGAMFAAALWKTPSRIAKYVYLSVAIGIPVVCLLFLPGIARLF